MTVRSTSCCKHTLQWSPSTNSILSLSVVALGVGDGEGDDDSSLIRFGGRGRVGLGLGLGGFIHGHQKEELKWEKLLYSEIR